MLKTSRQIIWIVVISSAIGAYINYDVLLDLLTEGHCACPEIVQVCGEQPVQLPTQAVDQYFEGQPDSVTNMGGVDPSQFFNHEDQ